MTWTCQAATYAHVKILTPPSLPFCSMRRGCKSISLAAHVCFMLPIAGACAIAAESCVACACVWHGCRQGGRRNKGGPQCACRHKGGATQHFALPAACSSTLELQGQCSCCRQTVKLFSEPMAVHMVLLCGCICTSVHACDAVACCCLHVRRCR